MLKIIKSFFSPVGGGDEKRLEASASGMQAKLVFFVFKKGGKPLFRLASYTRNVEGGGRLICHLLGLMFKPSFIGGVF